MDPMTSDERVKEAIRLEEPDYVPIFISGFGMELLEYDSGGAQPVRRAQEQRPDDNLRADDRGYLGYRLHVAAVFDVRGCRFIGPEGAVEKGRHVHQRRTYSAG